MPLNPQSRPIWVSSSLRLWPAMVLAAALAYAQSQEVEADTLLIEGFAGRLSDHVAEQARLWGVLAQGARQIQSDPVATEHDPGEAGRNTRTIVSCLFQQHAAQGWHRIPYRYLMALDQV